MGLNVNDWLHAATPNIAVGSIPGRPHLLAGRPNQDAVAYSFSQYGLVAVICDGCSSGVRSEVGAGLGAPLMARALEKWMVGIATSSGLDYSRRIGFALEQARQDVLAQLRILIGSMGGDQKQLVEDYFLFTVVAAIITPKCTVVAAIGDGMGGTNGNFVSIGPFPDNAPPYLAYDGLIRSTYDNKPELLRWRVITIVATAEIEYITIASDGAKDVEEAPYNGLVIPHRDELVPPFEHYWKDEALWKNPDMLRRRLAVLNPPIKPTRVAPDQEVRVWPTIIKDDTTIATIWLTELLFDS